MLFMSCIDPQNTIQSIASLRHELNRLIRGQLHRYLSAMSLSMNSPEAEQCDARREAIKKLVEELWQRRIAINNLNV